MLYCYCFVIIIAFVLASLGPEAFSIDARRYGPPRNHHSAKTKVSIGGMTLREGLLTEAVSLFHLCYVAGRKHSMP